MWIEIIFLEESEYDFMTSGYCKNKCDFIQIYLSNIFELTCYNDASILFIAI